MSPKEGKFNPLQSEMNNPAIEPVVKKYDELRYQLMPYTYTLAWEARNKGLPLMRSMWMHYPTDTIAIKKSDQFLWGRDLLIAPVYEKAATTRKVYLPVGVWYDWWTNEKQSGGKTISRTIDLSVMPIYVRAGAIIPLEPIRQYTAEPVTEPTSLKIFTGANGSYTLYEDDGISMEYLKVNFNLTTINWDDSKRKLTIESKSSGNRTFKVELIPQGIKKEISLKGSYSEMTF